MDSQQNITIHHLFEKCANERQDLTAIIYEGQHYTYGELNQRANQLAHYLRELITDSETMIAVALDRSFEFLVSVFGILKAGCAYVPLDETQPQNRLSYILADTKTPILITKASSKATFQHFTGKIILIDADDEALRIQPTHNPYLASKDNQLAYVIYTSGTTGKPKGVLIEHRNAVNYIQWFGNYTGCKSGDRVDFSADVVFDMAITSSLAPFIHGMMVVVCQDQIKTDMKEYLLFLKNNKINLIKVTPSFFRLMTEEIQNNQYDLASLKHIILGGEQVCLMDCTSWLEKYPQHFLYNEYGPTEATVAATQFKMTAQDIAALNQNVPIGTPGNNMQCVILTEKNELVERDCIGELYIGGNGLARGYLNEENLTQEKFIDYSHQNGSIRLYKTGDLCRYLLDGNIEFIRRVDDQVKIRGHRIEIGEIEYWLLAHHQIKNAAVIVQEDYLEEKQLVAYFNHKSEGTVPTHAELRLYLQQYLPDYMIPSFFEFLDVFPLTKNGKLDKKGFPLIYIPTLNQSIERLLTLSPLEEEVANIWREVFCINAIGGKDNFFELGGHSLAGARIIAYVEKRMGKKIGIKDLYQNPTIQQLAVIIEGVNKIDHNNVNLILNQKERVLPLSDFQFLFWISKLFEPKVKKLNIIARRRLLGRLDSKALSFAFESLIKKHRLLTCWIPKFIPIQIEQKNISFQLIESDIISLKEEEKESILSCSLKELKKHYPWNKGKPLLIAKLFYIENKVSELQVCLPHTVFDDASEEILFNELSKFYIEYLDKGKISVNNDQIQYNHYILSEQDHYQQHLERDINFWQNHLAETALYEFSADQIELESTSSFQYSSYIPFPNKVFEKIQQICSLNQVSITDVLCASTVRVLNSGSQKNDYKHNLINVIRSNRGDFSFDQTIGCFLRLDPIRIDNNSKMNLTQLSKHIQQSSLNAAPYQLCPSMVKLACLDNSYRYKPIRNYLINAVSTLASKLYPTLKLHPKIVTMYSRLNSIRKRNGFIVNINILNHFTSPPKNETLFGLKLIPNNLHRDNISNIDNVLDISFLRDFNEGQAYLVISAILKPSIRESMGHAILNGILNSPEDM